MTESIEKYQCQHEPKISKKIGMICGIKAEILVCKMCKNDSDLADFLEVELRS